MSRVLKMKFNNGEDKGKILSIANPKEGLTADQVRPVMETIANAGVFEKDFVKLYAKPVEAYYTTTTTDQIFDDEAAVDDANGAA